jgi:hypothetical protein
VTAAAFRPSTIEALKALWVALPVRASNDGEIGDPRERQMQILDTYCFALSEFSSEAIWNTVNSLRSGKIEEASKNFCPKAPELAVYVRNEQKRLDAINSPKAIPHFQEPKPFKDWRVIQQLKVEERAKTEGFVLLDDDISLEQFNTNVRRRKYPAGTTFYWAISQVWGPRA